jgi:hypothetical protein
MAFGFVLFGAILVFTLLKLDPKQGFVTVFTFYVSLTLTITCLFSLLSFMVRRKVTNNELFFANIKVSFRQALLLAVFADLTLFIASIGLLTWWDIILLALSLILLELYFESNKVKQVPNNASFN